MDKARERQKKREKRIGDTDEMYHVISGQRGSLQLSSYQLRGLFLNHKFGLSGEFERSPLSGRMTLMGSCSHSTYCLAI